MWLSTSTGRIAMTQSGMYRQFGPDTFANLERKIAAKQYVGPDELARVLRANGSAWLLSWSFCSYNPGGLR